MTKKTKKIISADCSAKSSPVKISRRRAIQSIGAVAGVAAIGIHAPYVNARQKTIRFLNGEPSVQSVRAMRFAAAQYEKETGVKVQMDTINTVF